MVLGFDVIDMMPKIHLKMSSFVKIKITANHE